MVRIGRKNADVVDDPMEQLESTMELSQGPPMEEQPSQEIIAVGLNGDAPPPPPSVGGFVIHAYFFVAPC